MTDPQGEIPEAVIEAARRKWAERLGVPLADVPWQVVFLSDRPLTERERQRGAELAQEVGA